MSHMCSFKCQKADILIHMNKSEHITYENGYIYLPFKNIRIQSYYLLLKWPPKSLMEKNNGNAGCFNLMHAAASHLGSSTVANANRPHRSKAAVKTGFRLDLRLICSSFH